MDLNKLLDASKNVDINKAFEDNEKDGKYVEDPRYFKLRQNNGVGKATIRWLPHLGGKVPFVKNKEHFIKYENKYYIENSRSTLGKGEKDPALTFMFKLWEKFNDTNDEYWKKLAKLVSPRDKYISLIYVVNDPNDTDEMSNTGLVKLYKYGTEILNKNSESAKKTNDFGPIPESKIIQPYSIGDDGANFGLVLKKETPDSKEFPNYKSSQFLDKGALFDGDKDALQNMFELNKDNFHDIYDEVVEDNFKPYEELEKNLISVFGDLYIDMMKDELRVTGSAASSDGDFKVDDDPTEGIPTTNDVVNEIDDEIPDFDNEVEDKKETVSNDDLSDFFNS